MDFEQALRSTFLSSHATPHVVLEMNDEMRVELVVTLPNHEKVRFVAVGDKVLEKSGLMPATQRVGVVGIDGFNSQKE
jgi:hypothetical protein